MQHPLVRYGHYLLWVLAGLCVLALGWPRQQPPQPAPLLTIAPENPQFLADSTGQPYLLTLRAVVPIRRERAGLRVGQQLLPVMTDTVGKTAYALPVSTLDWRNTLTDRLRSPGSDSALAWPVARLAWQRFVQPELDSLAKQPDWRLLTAEQQLSHALLLKMSRLPGASAYMLDGALWPGPAFASAPVAVVDAPVLLPVQAQTGLVQPAATGGPGWLWVLSLLTVLVGLAFTYWRDRPRPAFAPEPTSDPAFASERAHENERAHEPLLLPADVTAANAEPARTAPEPDQPEAETDAVSHAVLDRYLTNFYVRYGDFYKFMQDIPIEPDAAQQQQIRRRLVEMGLHAHSLARAYNHNPALDRIDDEPNLQLVLDQKQVADLPPVRYRRFDPDPYKSSKDHQFLRQVLQDLDLGQLNGVLMQHIYLSPLDLNKPTAP